MMQGVAGGRCCRGDFRAAVGDGELLVVGTGMLLLSCGSMFVCGIAVELS